MKRYDTIDKMLLDITTSPKFLTKWITSGLTKNKLDTYQKYARIYLDEYPEQKTLRADYLNIHKADYFHFERPLLEKFYPVYQQYKWFQQRFMRRM
jgi:hypothetical protein